MFGPLDVSRFGGIEWRAGCEMDLSRGPLPEIVLPETSPDLEWIGGRIVQKVSPKYRHGRLQYLLAHALNAWCGNRGRVATEWRFRIAPPGEIVRPLTPDVAYLSYETLGAAEDAAAQTPLGRPDVAIEILSPDDRAADVAEKVAVYVRAGSALVVVVAPEEEEVRAHDARSTVVFVRGDVFEHAALPGFALAIGALFDAAKR